MKIQESIQMNNGRAIPVLGVGLWQVSREDAARVVKEGIELGYRHIDDAAAYRNEEEAGEGIRLSGIAREELFVTTKIPAEFKSYEKAKQSIDDSLKRLGLDYIDLILIHAPRPWPLMWTNINYDKQNVAVYKAMEETLQAGKVRAIGVSNFSEHDIENILKNCQVKPAVNQICVFAGNTPKNLIEFCKKNDIVVEAYSPLGTGKVMKNDKLKEMAAKYGVSLPQLAIAYTLQLGCVSLPKTTHKEYLAANKEVDFVISEEDMEALLQMGIRQKAI